MTSDFIVSGGSPAPLGPTISENGVNFALFSAHATAVTLCLFSKTGKREIAQIPLTAKTGDIWHVFVEGLEAGQLYGYRVDGPYAPHEGHRFNRHKLLIDPYAKQLFGEFILNDVLYGFDVNSPEKDLSFDTRDSAPYMPKGVVGDVEFAWGGEVPPRTALSDTIIYECHAKGATKLHPDVPIRKRGTVEGLSSRAMIKHLKSLGVSAVEILPLQSFFSEPRLQEMGLTNYWGYNPVNYFAPHNNYLGPAKSKSIQTMVKAMHSAGIEVILDVVYNHTAESWELGPTLSYRGIDNKSYYHLKDDARYYENYTGCGNALNMTHPAVLDMTLASLRHWVEYYHIDGFRFDLGPTMGRNPKDFDRNAPFFTALENDPVLSNVKLIAEPWDIGPDGYQLGAFPQAWLEWNDQYRDCVRSFWRGDASAHQTLADRLLGSSKQFDHDKKSALSSINFISAHDGFTLHDTVSFNQKHNLANGENNRDGHGHNLSDNMGVEGPSDDPAIVNRRRLRKINMLATLLLSQGVPMLLGGDEIGQTQRGNNNAYCQDNDLTWLDWAAPDDLLTHKVSELVAIRKTYPHFGQKSFLHGQLLGGGPAQNAVWVNQDGRQMTTADWEDSDQSFLGLMLSIIDEGSVFIALNRGGTTRFKLPDASGWKQIFSSCETHNHNEISEQSVNIFHAPEIALTQDITEAETHSLAEAAGIISEFRDISGHTHIASVETKKAILEAMSSPNKTVKSTDTVLNRPHVFGAQQVRETGKAWGVTASLYGLRSLRNWGVGDFEDLAVFAESMAQQGASFVGINPVHALFPSAPNLYAPYSPSSRERINIMHIAPDKIAEISQSDLAEFESKRETLRHEKLVPYAEVCRLKMAIFETAFERFKTLPPTHKRKKEFRNFVKFEGPPLKAHSIFDAIFETLPEDKRTYDGFKNFPKPLQSPRSASVKAFAKTHRSRVEFYSYLQWIAKDQLSAAQLRAKAAGMSIGLYLDFAVGVVPGGSDAWRYGNSFAQNISLGAPGDAANPEGQMWNLLPFDPHRLAAHNYQPYRAMLAKTMEQAGAVRIDHILGHLRSFWTALDSNGQAKGGAYVRYPLRGLLNMIAEESQKANCLVIGEDLGTIPDGLRHEMEQFKLMGCGIALIERDSHGSIVPLEKTRELSLTAFSNHDFPTLKGFWQGEDFKWRQAHGISADEKLLTHERQRRETDKAHLLNQAGLENAPQETLTIDQSARLHTCLSQSPALLVSVQLEDLLMQSEQPNVPGTTNEEPNWRRKYNHLIEDMATIESFVKITEALRSARPL